MEKKLFNSFYTTEDNVEIHILPGQKSANDFIVKYRQPNKQIRTPKHIHLVIDILLKRENNKKLTLQLINEFLDILSILKPIDFFPPEFQFFKREYFSIYDDLNGFGEYSVEFLAAIFELIMIQEKTNYPNGVLNKKLFESIINGCDLYSIVSAATFRGV